MKRLIGAIKYRNRRGSFRWLALQVAAQQTESDFDCVTWLPSSKEGWGKRGYEPAKLLANGVAGQLRLPLVRLLRRAEDIPQSQRNRQDRLLGPALRLTRFVPMVRRVLIVDDVCTTGASLASAATTLREGGANVIHAAVVASTRQSTGISSHEEFCM